MTDPENTLFRAANGDADALERLVIRHLPTILRLAERYARAVPAAIRARESASDVAISVCRLFVEHLPRLREKDDLGDLPVTAYFRQMIENRWADKRRHHEAECRNPAREVAADNDTSASARAAARFVDELTPSRHVIGREQLDRCEQALQQLPDEQAEAIVLSRVLRLPHDEIAELQGCTPAAARKRLSRGLVRLGELLGVDAEEDALHQRENDAR